MSSHASHHIREDAFEAGSRQLARLVVQQDQVAGAQFAGERDKVAPTPVVGGGTHQRDLGPGRGISGERTSAKAAGLAWIRREAQQAKGHIGESVGLVNPFSRSKTRRERRWN
jgi:hypothetical protein